MPPPPWPLSGLTLLTVGAGYVNWSSPDVADVPPLAVVTVTSTVPPPGGESALMLVGLSTVTPVRRHSQEFDCDGAGKTCPCNCHWRTAGRSARAGAYTGHRGCQLSTVNSSELESEATELPLAVVTVTSTVPATPEGVVAVRLVPALPRSRRSWGSRTEVDDGGATAKPVPDGHLSAATSRPLVGFDAGDSRARRYTKTGRRWR